MMDVTSAWRNRQVAWLLGTLGQATWSTCIKDLAQKDSTNDDQEKKNDDADEARNERVI